MLIWVGGAECKLLLQGIILAADVYDQLMSTVKRDVTVSHCLQIVTAYLLLYNVYLLHTYATVCPMLS